MALRNSTRRDVKASPRHKGGCDEAAEACGLNAAAENASH